MNRPDAEQVLACALAVDRDLRSFPLMVGCGLCAETIAEDCEQCAGTGRVEAGWTATPTGEVTPMGSKP